MNMPAYHRTMEEFTAPLRIGTLTEDLILKEGIRANFSDQLWPEYEQVGDANAFAAAYTEFMRASTEAPLFAGLDADRTPCGPRKARQRVLRAYEKPDRSQP